MVGTTVILDTSIVSLGSDTDEYSLTYGSYWQARHGGTSQKKAAEGVNCFCPFNLRTLDP